MGPIPTLPPAAWRGDVGPGAAQSGVGRVDHF
jgi:hypothetical protein